MNKARTKLLAKSRDYLRKVPLGHNPLGIMAVFVFGVIILPIGPDLAFYASGIMNTAPADVQAALRISNFAEVKPFENLLSWMALPIFAIIVLVIFTAHQNDTLAKSFVKSSTCVFIVWVMTDAYVFFDNDDWRKFGAIVLENLIGGVVFGLLFYLSLAFSRYVDDQAGEKRSWLFVGAMATFASLVAALFYLTALFVYRPVPIQVNVLADRGQQIYFGSGESEAFDGSADFKGPFPRKAFAREVLTRGPAGRVEWRSLSNKKVTFDLKLSVYLDCDQKELQNLPPHTSAISFSDVSTFSIDTKDAWYSEIRVATEDYSEITRTKSSFGIFWLSEAGSDNPSQQANYQGEQSDLRLQSRDGLRAALNIVAVKEDGDGNVIKSPVELTIMVNNKPQALLIGLKNDKFENNALDCRGSDRLDAVKVESSATLVMDLVASDDDLIVPRGPLSQFDFGIKYGDAWIYERDESAFDGVSLGQASFFGIVGAAPRVEVEGVYRELPDGDRPLYLHGKFDTFARGIHAIEIDGVAEYAWFDDRPLSKSRWEALPDDWQKWILGGLAAMLAALIRFFALRVWSVRNELSFRASL